MQKLLFIFSIVLAAQAQTVHVDYNGPANGNGSNQAPFKTIAAAVAYANALPGSPTIQVEPGIYEIADTMRIEKGLTLRGSTQVDVDSQGFPTGVIHSATDAHILGTAALGTKPLFSFGKSGQVIQNITVRGLTFEAAPGNGSIMDFARVQNFEVRDSILLGSPLLTTPGIQSFASSGTIRDTYMSGLQGGAFISAGYAGSPADVTFRNNRVIHGRVGVFLAGTSDGITEPGNNLTAMVRDNDISDNNAANSVGVRIIVKGNESIPGYGSTGLSSGNIQATIRNNRLVGNTIGISIDAGFVTRLVPPIPSTTCDTRLFTGLFDLSFRDNTLTGSLSKAALISFTQLQATLGTLSLSRTQYLHIATFRIDDRDHVFTGALIDHPEKDQFVGGPCSADTIAESLGNMLSINGLPVGNTPPLQH